MKFIYWIGGRKGGVGRSLVSRALLHYLLEQGEAVRLVEANVQESDVAPAYPDVPCEVLDLDDANGWVDLINSIAANLDCTTVINATASCKGFNRYGPNLNYACNELGLKLITFWVVHPRREDLKAMEEYLERLPNAKVHLIWNEYLGIFEEFESIHGKTRELVEARGGLCLPLSSVGRYIADTVWQCKASEIRGGEWSEGRLPLFQRLRLRRWLRECEQIFDVVEGRKPKEECKFLSGWNGPVTFGWDDTQPS